MISSLAHVRRIEKNQNLLQICFLKRFQRAVAGLKSSPPVFAIQRSSTNYKLACSVADATFWVYVDACVGDFWAAQKVVFRTGVESSVGVSCCLSRQHVGRPRFLGLGQKLNPPPTPRCDPPSDGAIWYPEKSKDLYTHIWLAGDPDEKSYKMTSRDAL